MVGRSFFSQEMVVSFPPKKILIFSTRQCFCSHRSQTQKLYKKMQKSKRESPADNQSTRIWDSTAAWPQVSPREGFHDCFRRRRHPLRRQGKLAPPPNITDITSESTTIITHIDKSMIKIGDFSRNPIYGKPLPNTSSPVLH